MTWTEFWAHLRPCGAERDPGFRQELVRQSVRGLSAVGVLSIAISLFLTVARFAVLPDPATLPLRLAEDAVMITIGLILIGLARQKAVAPYARGIGLAAGFVYSLVLMWFAFCMCTPTMNVANFIPGEVTLVLLMGIAAFPLRPLQTFGLGMAMLVNYVVSAQLAEQFDLPIGPLEPTYVLFMLTTALLGTALTAVVYSERAQSYFRYRKALETERDLKETQRRVILAENAASLGRLAAALSHELNSPIGALSSAVDTLLLLSAKQSTKPIDPQRFVVLLNDLRKTISDSTNRLSDIVSRMQRISNLDRSEVQRVCVNELIHDAVEISGARLRERAKLNLDLAADIPSMICKPQQLSAVFRNLVTNSADALNGNGQIRITSRLQENMIQVEVADNGKGMNKEQLSSLFDPEFRVDGNRVGTGNWSMFSARQVVREHGGEITVNSKPGEGTRVLVTFPIQHFEASALT